MTPRQPSNAPTIIALLALLAAGGGLLGLTAMILPQAFGLLAVVFGFFAFGAIHYLMWGWWTPPDPERVERDEAAASRKRAEQRERESFDDAE